MKRFLLSLICASSTLYGSAIVVTNPALVHTSDILDWAQLGSAGSLVYTNSYLLSSGDAGTEMAGARLANGTGMIETACASGCGFQANSGIAANDALLLTTNGYSKSAPITLSVMPAYGLGTYLQEATATGDAGGQFTARIQAYAGVSSVLDASVTSDAAGDAVFLGVSDTARELTKVIFSMTDSNGKATNFVLDTVYIQNTVALAPPPLRPLIADGAPEPGVISLFGSGLLALAFGFRKRAARG